MILAEFSTFALIALTSLRIAEAENQPKIFTKEGSVHIHSGDNGNIVFEPSQQGKVMVGKYEVNVNNSVGPKGVKGDRGGSGVKGDRGDIGPTGLDGQNGTTGANGTKGFPGPTGSQGSPGIPGFNGTGGAKGDNGTQGAPGLQGPKGDVGQTPYYIDDGSQKLQCNISSYGILRYFSTKLQLCTPKGWRYLAFHGSELPLCSSDINVPETNLKAFYAANPGIMFQFNNNSSPLTNPSNRFNITAGISPENSTLSYEDAIMGQAVKFSGDAYLNVSGIPEDFWRTSSWSVMALMKFGDVNLEPSSVKKEIGVLGHGTPSRNTGLHLGVSNRNVIHGYYGNDLIYNVNLTPETWYHLTWTSEKTAGNDKRCIVIDGDSHKCVSTKISYQGTGDTTVGTWWHRTHDNNLVLDNLIIASGVVQYKQTKNREKQVCYARVLERNLP